MGKPVDVGEKFIYLGVLLYSPHLTDEGNYETQRGEGETAQKSTRSHVKLQ